MDYCTHDCGNLSASVNISHFQGRSGVDEYHLIVRPTEYGSIDVQLEWLLRAYRSALDAIGLGTGTAILRRFFCSDLVNQAAAMKASPISNPGGGDVSCALSWVGQPPVPPAKVTLWAYHIRDPKAELEKVREGTHLALRRGELSHHWTTGITCPTGETSYGQTRGVFERYDALLAKQGLSLADNVIRTWLFVRDIDANYQGLVAARREFFAECGLTPDTHFIASSGIEGASADVAAGVAMDAYAISGVRPDQIEYLAAPDHLSPTQTYGVTFERGTSVAYRDRTHVIISGTASIDHHGNILYPGDVSRQLDRTLDNIDALLKQAGAALEDMCVFIVYLRDPSDHAVARRRMQDRFGDAPIEILVAPVCRPGWLIEVEGMAVIPASNPTLPLF
jgi:enamine deaminase RidA (YjgF/YER057c/UK114 family)